MTNPKELSAGLRCCATEINGCDNCPRKDHDPDCDLNLMRESADMIDNLLRICSKMHTWIFLHTGDEQKAYDEIGLTDEQNAMLGYLGQCEFTTKKEETE